MSRPRVIWLVITLTFGVGMSVAAAVMIATSRSEVSSARRIFAGGTQVRCTIVSKRGGTTAKGRSRYFVTLQRRDRADLPPFERRVADQAWLDANPGAETVFYVDPERPDTGVAEIERTQIEDSGIPGQIVFLLAALGWTGMALRDVYRRKRS